LASGIKAVAIATWGHSIITTYCVAFNISADEEERKEEEGSGEGDV
jgi:hypothetical protein